MTPILISPHVTLDELVRSNTAMRRGIDNTPPPPAIERLRLVCEKIVEPARAHFGMPVKISSGYRSPKLNVAVGGTTDSQHCKGEAVDFEIPGVTNIALALWVRDRLDFDQLILEAFTPGDPNSGWVHCSYRAAGNRKSVLTMRPSLAPKYVEGIRP